MMEENKITLEFDDGVVLNCEIMGLFEVKDVEYIALLEEETEDVYLYRYIAQGDDFELGDIPEDEFDEVSAEFDAIMDSLEHPAE